MDETFKNQRRIEKKPFREKAIRFGSILFFVFFFIHFQTQGQVQGFVYEDLNGNGKREAMEEGIPGVGVTNGVEVVLSGENGAFELPIGKHTIVSVIKPSHYQVPVDENNLPQFFYIHKPQGSGDLRFEGVAPTGELPASVDFGLRPTEEKEDFSILVFGDPQPYNLKQVTYFEKGIIEDLTGTAGYTFGMSLGDLVGNDLKLFDPYINAISKAGIPWYNVLGNHDLNFDVKEDRDSDETYEAHFGPANFAFNVGKVHFIIVDDILYPDPRDGQGYQGGFREDQLDFLENDLKTVPKDHLIVLAMHIPLSERGGGNSFRDKDRERLFRILKDFPHTLSLSAHTHLQRQDFITAEEGWLREEPHHHFNVGTTSGDWYSGGYDEKGIPFAVMRDGTPKGYAILNFTGNQYSIDYKVAGRSEDYQIEIFAPKVLARGRRTKAGIYANFFMGSPSDTLKYRIDERPWKRMHQVEAHDPSFEKYIYRWDLAEELPPGRRPSNPSLSTHLWRGDIPVDLEEGEHTIEVMVRDRYGRTFTQTGSYRLVDPAPDPVPH